VEYWNAIQDPDKIRTFDWSQYVLQKLLDGVVKVKTKLMNKKKVPNITGCALFLEVNGPTQPNNHHQAWHYEN